MRQRLHILWLVWLALAIGDWMANGQTNRVFLETMGNTAVNPWIGGYTDNSWLVTGYSFTLATSWNCSADTNVNSCGLQFKEGTANLTDSMMATAPGISATGTIGYVEFWIKTTGLTPNAGWTFQVNSGSGFVTRLSELTGVNHIYQLYHYDLQPGELVSNLNLRFQFAGGASTNRIDLDYISVGVVAAVSSSNTTFNGSLILGRPTANSMAINALANTNLTAYFEYGTQSGIYTSQTPITNLLAGQPLEVNIGSLQTNTRYYYRLRFQTPGDTTFLADTEHTFITQRPPGSTFTFCIHGDSHPERTNNMYNANFYALTLNTAAADQPDFYMTIGDDFSVDNIPTNEINQAAVTYRYALQRQYLGLVGASAPVFLVNGNHEEASRWAFLNTNLVAPGYSTVTYSNVATWAQIARNQFYSEPAPDNFYSGMTNDALPGIGSLRSCYAWTWGDALFVTLSAVTTTSSHSGNGLTDIQEYQYGLDPNVWSSANNGIPDGWAIKYGFDPTLASVASLINSNGNTTLQNYTADLNPTNAASRLAFTGLNFSNTNLQFTWIGGVNATQYLLASPTLTASQWNVVFTNAPPTSITNYLVLPVGTSNLFYRIEATR